MTWTRLGDNFYDRPDLGRVSRSARLLFVEMLVYCNRELLDGAFPRHMLRRVSDAEDVDELLAELVTAGTVTPTDEGVLQVDWSDQEPAELVRARQGRQADKQRRYRLRKELHAAGDHSKCDSRFCKGVTGNATGNETGDVTGLVTLSRPVPSRPEGTGDRDAGERGAGAPSPTLRAVPADGVCACEVPGRLANGDEDCFRCCGVIPA